MAKGSYRFEIFSKSLNRKMKNIIDESPDVNKTILNRLGLLLLKKVIELTPVDTGWLSEHWFLQKPKEKEIEIKNNTNYGLAVEKGHKIKGGGFRKGRFMLAKAILSVEFSANEIISSIMQKFLDSKIK